MLMHRKLCLAAGSLLLAQLVHAQALELKRVSLSSAGLGYFEYEARVENNAVLSLQVNLDQVNDVLKSLVVYDDKGGIGGLSLPGKEPMAEALRQLPFDVRDLGNMPALLGALRGAELAVTGPRAMRGRIMSVQTFSASAGGRDVGLAQERHRVTLLTDGGMQQFVLEEAGEVQFVDEPLRRQMQRALAAMDRNRARDSRTIELVSTGVGARTVRVAYMASAPIWKVAYRLTVPASASAPQAPLQAQLQGWAVVENMSGQDWRNVELTLTSGRPVAFRQDLYSAVFSARPEVRIELPSGVVPRSDVGAVSEVAPVAARSAYAPAPAPAPAAAPAMRSVAKETALVADGARGRFAEAADPVAVQDAATQVSYRFPLPVSVSAGRSLSVPIIQSDVPVSRSAFFQPGVDARYPLAAIELRNASAATLPAGAVTVYESDGHAGSFVGDSQLGTLPPGDSRFLSFAVDQKMSVTADTRQSQDVKRLVVERAVLTVETLDRRTTTYTVKSSGSANPSVVVELPRLAGWTLLPPPGVLLGQAGNQHRVSLPVAGTAPQAYTLVQERPQVNRVELAALDMATLNAHLLRSEMNDATRASLQRLKELREAKAAAETRRAAAEHALEQQAAEQARLRDNLKASQGNAALQKRYANSLEQSENQIERSQQQRAGADAALVLAQAAIDAFLKP